MWEFIFLPSCRLFRVNLIKPKPGSRRDLTEADESNPFKLIETLNRTLELTDIRIENIPRILSKVAWGQWGIGKEYV